MAKEVVFLMSDTGGGHRASANALAGALHRLHGDSIRCRVVDLFTDFGAWPLSRASAYYRPLVDRHLWLWRAMAWTSDQPLLWQGLAAAARLWQAGGLRRFAAEYPADLYVSVHPLLNHTPFWALRRRFSHARFATVVTDLESAPRSWHNPAVDWLSASCPQVQAAAVRAGVPGERVQLCGLPIRLDFGQAQPERAQARAALGLAQRPTVLLLGGGEGMGALESIAAALASMLARCNGQLAVICGRNQALASRLASQAWPAPVRVAGYVDDMPLWMAAADLLVSKAGPGTIAEALACGLPMILSSFVPGQESGNVRFVEENGVGVYRSDPAQIASVAAAWLEPGSAELPARRARARELARPDAALDIARGLSRLLGAPDADGPGCGQDRFLGAFISHPQAARS